MLKLRKGTVIWLPCEIRSGPFPNERRVRVRLGDSEWFGFVQERQLDEATNRVRATVVRIERETIFVNIHGHSPTSHMIQTPPRLVQEPGALAP